MGGRPQAASLVQGLRPRNAPLQNPRRSHPPSSLLARRSNRRPDLSTQTAV